MTDALSVAKGHGTQNDFVLVLDPAGERELDVRQVAALCDRRAGIGGDGLIRVVRSTALADGAAQAGEAEWFMDYRNGDGSTAQMCGNGIRVFVAYLVHLGLAGLDDGEALAVGTRSGVKRVRRDGSLLAVDLGPWRIPGGAAAAAAGADVTVSVPGVASGLPGLAVEVGNPHVVVALPEAHLLVAADLDRPPVVDPLPAEGANIEVVVPLAPSGPDGRLAMRVHERGVGETRSCGSGAVAAVVAARAWGGTSSPELWWVDVPGGRLRVTVPADCGPDAGEVAELAGPAVLVAEGTLHPDWSA
jgi:diaminopimelate epimerase